MNAQMKSLGQTELYKTLNGPKTTISNAMIGTVKTGRVINLPTDLPEAYDRITRYSYPNKVDIINAVADGKIVIVRSKTMDKVPSYIPAYVIKSNDGKFTAYADITHISTENADGKLRLNDKDLFAVLTTAYITYNCYKNWVPMRLMASKESFVSAYTKLMMKVMNRLFSLSTNTVTLEKVTYVISKFYILNVLGAGNSTDTINTICMKSAKSLNTRLIQDIDNYIGDEDYKDLNSLLKAIATHIPACAKLTQSGFMNSFVTTYGVGSVFAIEFLPSFLTLIDFVMTGSYLTVNTNTVEKVIDKEASECYRLMNQALKDHSR
ncbi:MAG: hypothetical protein ACRCXX_04190 [Cetobacterium sp.]|uniref:hypothetical protein n=1 Tax=Cetobacterium sp. TaxID=2071632 RepID=UPI003F3C6F35